MSPFRCGGSIDPFNWSCSQSKYCEDLEREVMPFLKNVECRGQVLTGLF